MKKYDTTFIINGKLGHDEREALITRFSNSLEKNGGKIDKVVRWGIRTLAYEINKTTKGFYIIFYYNAEGAVISKFERELRINENVMRYMTIVFDEKNTTYLSEGRTARTGYPPAKIPENISDTPMDDDVVEDTTETEEVPDDSVHSEDDEIKTEPDSEVAASEETDEEGENKEEKTETE